MLHRIVPVVLTVLALAVLVSPAIAADTKGKVASVDKDKLTVTVDGKDQSFTVPAAAKVTMDGKDAKLADLKKGNGVTVTTEKKEGKDVVTKVAATSK